MYISALILFPQNIILQLMCFPQQSGYRSAIHQAVPQLKFLDDLPLTSEAEGEEREDSSLSSRSTLFAVSEAGVESDWRIVQQCIKQSSLSKSQLLEEDSSATDGSISATTNVTIGTPL